MAQTFSGFPKALQIILHWKENKLPNVRIPYVTEIELHWAFTTILTHYSLESAAVSDSTS